MSAWDDYSGRQDDIGGEIADRESRHLPPAGEILVRRAVHSPWVFTYRPPLFTDDPIELLRRHVMDFGACDARETCDCSDGQAWRWLRDHGIIDP